MELFQILKFPVGVAGLKDVDNFGGTFKFLNSPELPVGDVDAKFCLKLNLFQVLFPVGVAGLEDLDNFDVTFKFLNSPELPVGGVGEKFDLEVDVTGVFFCLLFCLN